MLNKVRTYIEREIGIASGDLVFVGLSGGADSTALLLILKELGYRLHAMHCNFHLRGEESDRDQTFVEELCRQQDVPLSVHHFQTRDEARRRGISIEMAARDLRYDWFRSVLNPQSPVLNPQSPVPDSLSSVPDSLNNQTFVAVAHHLEDQAETLLLNLLRGTGLRGMAGMHPRHDGIIRPLLCVSRDEILQYLESRDQTYVTDSTNNERDALRNRLRLDLFPLLRDLNPAAVQHLCRACDNVRQSLPYYIKGVEASFAELGISEENFPLSALPSLTLLHEWLANKGFNATQESEMLRATDMETGKLWHSDTHQVLRDRKALILSPLSLEQAPPQLGQEIVACMQEQGPNVAYFDADLLDGPIEVRPIRQGDAFVPFGMKGRKLVSDYLTDRKVNRLQKAEQYVATCGDDIIWLIGHRSDNRFRVSEHTKRILKLTCISF